MALAESSNVLGRGGRIFGFGCCPRIPLDIRDRKVAHYLPVPCLWPDFIGQLCRSPTTALQTRTLIDQPRCKSLAQEREGIKHPWMRRCSVSWGCLRYQMNRSTLLQVREPHGVDSELSADWSSQVWRERPTRSPSLRHQPARAYSAMRPPQMHGISTLPPCEITSQALNLPCSVDLSPVGELRGPHWHRFLLLIPFLPALVRKRSRLTSVRTVEHERRRWCSGNETLNTRSHGLTMGESCSRGFHTPASRIVPFHGVNVFALSNTRPIRKSSPSMPPAQYLTSS